MFNVRLLIHQRFKRLMTLLVSNKAIQTFRLPEYVDADGTVVNWQ